MFLSISMYTNEFRFEFESFIQVERVLSIPGECKSGGSSVNVRAHGKRWRCSRQVFREEGLIFSPGANAELVRWM